MPSPPPEPWKDDEDEDDGPQFIPDPPLPQSVKDIWERKRRRQQSVKDANTMWLTILEHYREYNGKLQFIPWEDR